MEVARQASRVATVLSGEDGHVLVAAAYLHDVGYAVQLVRTGFHPLDGADHLRELCIDHRVCCLVAHHSAARFEAAERGLLSELDAYQREVGPVMDGLIYADMTTGSAGQQVDVSERIDNILRRYDREGPVGRVICRQARPALQAAVERTKRRLDMANQPM
ncbi:MAG: HD domain-containing protein [Actinomycetota bacterium]|nr:HD domain-containing protein [Actinomycetota bacterium]